LTLLRELALDDVAQAVNLSRPFISMVERGETDISMSAFVDWQSSTGRGQASSCSIPYW
jgi:hypothetical protein